MFLKLNKLLQMRKQLTFEISPSWPSSVVMHFLVAALKTLAVPFWKSGNAYKFIWNTELRAMCPELCSTHPCDIETLCCLSSCLRWEPSPKTANEIWRHCGRRGGTGASLAPSWSEEMMGSEVEKVGKESRKKKYFSGKRESQNKFWEAGDEISRQTGITHQIGV